MWLLNTTTIELKSFSEDKIPEYAILSHTWGYDEVLFEDVYKKPVEQWKDKVGGVKVLKFVELASQRGINYVWVDPCCIDKRSSSELSEAINSMFKWYRNSRICYAYLSDVLSTGEEDSTDDGSTDGESIDGEDLIEEDQRDYVRMIGHRRRVRHSKRVQRGKKALQNMMDRRNGKIQPEWKEAPPLDTVPFEKSRWFKRGWTVRYAYIYLVLLICEAHQALLTFKQLQELIAPSKVQFWNREWSNIGSRSRWSGTISLITGIDESVLKTSLGLRFYPQSVHTKMTWAQGRETTREEDGAYSLMGLFQVNMPLLYGEGCRAFHRLFDEIIKKTGDQSILLQESREIFYVYPSWSPDAYEATRLSR
ncbi:hypothetical protein ANO14919_113530 [Xylariales sp. No.14919]|nr:hypothetical protein ANO14919_113530 [Xylariales sp. No.14919]